ncbi:MAG TPA: CHRD domain-containing protein, partial [Ramlibacter sp.]|nr:CHRD domain-containing protein [Ramlibacter sp.]
TFPNGEIRGQIGRHVGFARLIGTEEVPPTASAATGTGMLVIDPATRAASGRITVSGMTTTMAHVHQAAPGVNGPIIIPLTDAGGGNVWNVPATARLSAEQFTAFKQGNLYYNAHSAPFPNGEIRGQIRAP